MGFRIYKWIGSQPIWLKSLTPDIKWGPPERAMSFGRREEAIRASRLLPAKDQPAMVVDGGSRPDPIPVGRDQASG
jgi:hypothetical protein